MLELRVRSVTNVATGINTYELVDPAGADLPPFSAGSHVDVHVPGNFVRQYSLSNDPSERKRYVIGVLDAACNSRGGSRAMHAAVHAGAMIKVSIPRNNFPLREDARRYVLIAGGIGITPIMSMVRALESRGSEYVLHYCSRSPDRTAFREELEGRVLEGKVVYHYDHGDPAKGIPVSRLLEWADAGTHLYYCGPSGLMAAIAAASAHWPVGTVHCEHFAAPPAAWPQKETSAATGEFQVRIASTGLTLPVQEGVSILQTLREAGVPCESSCEAGVCGSCRTRYIEGTPDHSDFVLDEAERGQYLMICCSRAQSELLVLDL